MSNQQDQHQNENFESASPEEQEFAQNHQEQRDFDSSIADPEGGDNPLRTSPEGTQYEEDPLANPREQATNEQATSEQGYSEQGYSKQEHTARGYSEQENAQGETTNVDPDLVNDESGSDPYSESQQETEQREE
ncbi:hypothetical protein [Neomicrococcus lactis]|uniref:Uncharacterized protein n=1 Tax=Neomicrococcus lactis TaxID=732241 RepID=A0A7W8YC31_9MICC|nr:hypothetical protein [Neomicrococcus lactis]MBB5598647.1 hypothetical protein [Neomicrococcus lactis]